MFQQLVLFVQHRDPRYKLHQAKLAQAKAAAKNNKSKGPLPASTRSASPAMSAAEIEEAKKREQAKQRASAARYEEQDWQKVKEDDLSDEEEEVEEGDGSGVRIDDGAGGEAFECVACSKTFMSEASWENHERSKKHKQAVYRYVSVCGPDQ